MHSFKHWRHIPKWLAALPLAAAMAGPAFAQAAFPMETTPVTLDGTPLGTQTTGSGLINTVVLVDGVYHMWVIKSGADSYVSKTIHATSADGIRFTSDGTMTVPEKYWQLPCGATDPTTLVNEPTASRLRVSQVDGQWIMTVWHGNQPGTTLYSYNTSIWRIGADPNSHALSLIGPLPAANCAPADNKRPGNNHVGVFGMTASQQEGGDLRIWLRQESNSTPQTPTNPPTPTFTGGNLGGYAIDFGPPITTSTVPAYDRFATETYQGDLFADTGYYEYPIDSGSTMVHAIGRTLDHGGGTFVTYYALMDRASQVPREHELWYVKSTDYGENWGVPTRIYGDGVGDGVLVNGMPATYGFRAPEVVAGGERTYFWTRDVCNNHVMVTAIDEQTKPKLNIAKDFEPNQIDVGATSQLTVTVTAPTVCQPAPEGDIVTNIMLTDTLPGEGKVTLTGTTLDNTCGGTVTANAGETAITLTGAGLPMGGSCEFTVEVKGNAAGVYPNVIPVANVTNDLKWAAAEDARDTLTVGAPPPATVTPVPTTGPLSLAALAGLLGFFAVRRNRKSKKD